jgi:hypothetical protein
MNYLKNKIKRIVDLSIDHFLEYVFAISPQPLFVKAMNKYPNHRYLIYILWQIKGILMFIMLCFIIWFITHKCNPDDLCKSCIDAMNERFNISNITMPDNFKVIR